MAVYSKRKKQIQELMSAKGVDAMLIAGAENYYYITGDYRRQARMLFYKRRGSYYHRVPARGGAGSCEHVGE